MPLNETPAFFHPETRSLIDSTLEQAWLELRRGELSPSHHFVVRVIRWSDQRLRKARADGGSGRR